MSYCSEEDVRNVNTLILTEDNVSSSAVANAIKYAESVINGVLCSSYTVPFSPVPDLIWTIAVNLASARLLAQRTGNTGEDKEPTQAQELRKEAMDLLYKIKDGKISLYGDNPQVESQAQITAYSSTYGVRRNFARWTPGRHSYYSRRRLS